MTSRKDIAQLAAVLANRDAAHRGNSERVAEDALKLARYGAAAATNSTALCNGWKDQHAYDKKARSIEKNADKIAHAYGLRTHHTGDPRGFCLRLFAIKGEPLIRGNTWGGDESGYGI